jgi:alkylation response protein AidB-like acyl-CoA dehydrogenase
MAKLFGAELQQRIAATAVQIFGMEGQAARAGSKAESYQYSLLRSVANTIEGGTSEIQRSVIATLGGWGCRVSSCVWRRIGVFPTKCL